MSLGQCTRGTQTEDEMLNIAQVVKELWPFYLLFKKEVKELAGDEDINGILSFTKSLWRDNEDRYEKYFEALDIFANGTSYSRKWLDSIVKTLRHLREKYDRQQEEEKRLRFEKAAEDIRQKNEAVIQKLEEELLALRKRFYG